MGMTTEITSIKTRSPAEERRSLTAASMTSLH